VTASGCKTASYASDIKGIMGPAGRKAHHALAEHQRDNQLQPIEGQGDFDKAKKIYDEKNYVEAEKKFKSIAKKYKDKPIEEDAMFMLAECRFQQERYPAAQDAYDELMKKYTSSRYLEQSTRRMWKIALLWLGKDQQQTDVQLASYSEKDPDSATQVKGPDAPSTFPLKPNFFDRSRPAFDTHGRALQALHSIWLRDPTGPLADDALMLTATEHLRAGDNREADRFFTIIREEYPQSPYSQPAYVFGSKVKQAAYQGAKYDGRQLEEAKKLTQSTVRLFPESPHRTKLMEELGRISLQTAERDWEKVQFYMRKGRKDSAAVYCELIIESYPRSPYAALAKEQLRDLGPKYAKGFLHKQSEIEAPVADAPPKSGPLDLTEGGQ